jgi:MHS family proline/betaine transporter-like MFS transporter
MKDIRGILMKNICKHFNKIILISSIGTVIEWSEFAFYGYMTIQIAKLFFPQQDPRAAILSTLGLFAAGFIMRPLGSIVIGHIADTRGRKKALLYSMVLLGLATFCIGILPTYQSVGLIAPALLLVCRLLQGFAVASECFGAAVFLIEHAKEKNQILAGSWPGLAAALGATIGGIGALCVAQSTWSLAWRIPFIIGSISCVIGLYLRQKIAESPIFQEMYDNNKLVRIPLLSIMKKHSTRVIKCVAMGMFVATIMYVCNIYFLTYLIQMGKMPTDNALLVTTIGQFMVVLFFPLGALAANKFGIEFSIRLNLILVFFSAPFIFILGKTGNIYFAFCAQFIYAFLNAMITAPMFKWLYDEFSASMRVTGITVPWNLSVALLGGTSPLIVQYLLDKSNCNIAPGFYVSFSAIIMLFCTYLKSSAVQSCELTRLNAYT